MPGGLRAFEFARRLVERGNEVHVVTSDTRSPRARMAQAWRTSNEAGIHVHWAAVPYRNSMSFRQRLRAFSHFALLAAGRAASIPHDVAIASSTPLTIALPAAYAARRQHAPMVFEVRDVWPEVPIALGMMRSPLERHTARALERWAYRRSHHVIALSPDMAASIRRRNPGLAVSMIPNGCDLDLFSGAGEAGESLRRSFDWLGPRPAILYAGALGSVNGVRYLIEMAHALLSICPEIRVMIAGTGSEEAVIRRLAIELGVLDRNLFLLGEMTKREVVRMHGACNLAVSTLIDNPALRGASQNKIFDALAAGRPVAMNHGGWLADLILSEGAGVLLPPGDPSVGASRVAAFLADPALMARAGAAAIRLAREHFDRDVLFRRWEGILHEAAGGG